MGDNLQNDKIDRREMKLRWLILMLGCVSTVCNN